MRFCTSSRSETQNLRDKALVERAETLLFSDQRNTGDSPVVLRSNPRDLNGILDAGLDDIKPDLPISSAVECALPKLLGWLAYGVLRMVPTVPPIEPAIRSLTIAPCFVSAFGRAPFTW